MKVTQITLFSYIQNKLFLKALEHFETYENGCFELKLFVNLTIIP